MVAALRTNPVLFIILVESFRVFIDHLQHQNKEVHKVDFSNASTQMHVGNAQVSLVEKINNKILNRSATINSVSKKLRTYYRVHETQKLKNKFLEDYPPVPLNRELFK